MKIHGTSEKKTFLKIFHKTENLLQVFDLGNFAQYNMLLSRGDVNVDAGPSCKLSAEISQIVIGLQQS